MDSKLFPFARLLRKAVDINFLIWVIQDEETHIQKSGDVVCYNSRLSRKFYYNPGILTNEKDCAIF